MAEGKIVWSDEEGDLRKKNSTKQNDSKESVDESQLNFSLRRLTTGKGRTVIEIGRLPNNKNWCKKLAKDIKKSLGVGGAYKNDVIEVHGEKLDKVKKLLDKMKIKWTQTGG